MKQSTLAFSILLALSGWTGNLVHAAGIGSQFTASDDYKNSTVAGVHELQRSLNDISNHVLNVTGGKVYRIYSAMHESTVPGVLHTVSNNEIIVDSLDLNLSKGVAIVGGGYVQRGSAISNKVRISNTAIHDVYGGISQYGSAIGNEVTINDGVAAGSYGSGVYGFIVGGLVNNAVLSESVAKENIVTINTSNENFITYVLGGVVRKGSGSEYSSADSNQVILNSGHISSITGGQSATGDATGNEVVIRNGLVADRDLSLGTICSGDAEDLAFSNKVTISGGKIIASIYGGSGTEANNNEVIISGGEIIGTIYAGVGTSSANNNRIEIQGTANLTRASLFGGLAENATGNTLDVDNWTGTIESIKGFDTINFKNVSWAKDTTLVGTTDLELNDTKITVSVTGGSISNDTESMTLISSTNDIVGSIAAEGNTVTLYSGIANTYSGTVSQDAKTISVTLNKSESDDSGDSGNTGSSDDTGDSGNTGGSDDAGDSGNTGGSDDIGNTDESNSSTTIVGTMNDQILVLGESRSAATAFVNQGSDLIDLTLEDLGRKGALGSRGFATIHGNASNYETGSHVDVNGWSMIAGGAHTMDSGLTVGAFFESGKGNYHTFNELDGIQMRGDGEATYYGGGLFARQSIGNGFYTEASVRDGNLKNELAGAVRGSEGFTGYDIGTFYVGAHIGAGKIFALNDAGNNIDVYGKFLYTYNDSETFKIDGDTVDFDSVSSERLRLGARLNMVLDNMTHFRVGAAWEYEFNGDSENTVANYDLGTPSLGGSSYIGELGLHHFVSDNCSFDLSVRGYGGKREGVSGNFTLNYTF